MVAVRALGGFHLLAVKHVSNWRVVLRDILDPLYSSLMLFVKNIGVLMERQKGVQVNRFSISVEFIMYFIKKAHEKLMGILLFIALK